MTPTRDSRFRRRPVAPRHKRRNPLWVLLKPVAAAVLVAAPLCYLGYWVLTSPRFALREVGVHGIHYVELPWIEEALSDLNGRHLVWLTLAEVETRLAPHPWIAGAAIRKTLPGRLRVDVVERRPAALLRRDAELYYVDEDGVAFARFGERGPADLPLVSGPSRPADLRAALAVIERFAASHERWGPAISEVEILGGGDYRVHTGTLPAPVVMAAGRIEEGVRDLERWLPAIERRYPRWAAVDVRFAQQIVIRPLAVAVAVAPVEEPGDFTERGARNGESG